jgi:AcrR family transcriptional regulator
MDDIAAEAKVAKGTLYYYFKNKSELFKTVVVEGINYLTDELVKIVNKSDDSIEDIIKSLIKRNIDFYLEYHELANIVLNEITNGIDEDVLSDIKNAKNRYIVFLADLLSEGHNQGLIRYSDFNMIAAGIIGMIDGVCKYYLKNDKSMDRKKMIEYTSNIIINGLFP